MSKLPLPPPGFRAFATTEDGRPPARPREARQVEIGRAIAPGEPRRLARVHLAR